MSAIDNLNKADKVFLQQVAANPVFMQLIQNQKEEIQEQIINFWAQKHESDAEYKNRNELLHMKSRYLDEQIKFYESLL